MSLVTDVIFGNMAYECVFILLFLFLFFWIYLNVPACEWVGGGGMGEVGGPSILEQVDCFDPVSFPAINSHYVCNYICWVDFIVLE